jgi:L-seryl-tRNA(Ser) seleniumtransferase
MEDLGSGNFIDFSRCGLAGEPTVQQSVAAGVDVVTFSGDKLLGGPQAGIILGNSRIIQKIRHNPLTRALRIDKLTLAVLEATLHLYRDPNRAMTEIPTLRMLTLSADELACRAKDLAARIQAIADERLEVQVVERFSKAGGGALPLLDLKSHCLAIRVNGLSTAALEKRMRSHCPPIIGRIDDDMFLMDLRTIQPDEPPIIVAALQMLLQRSADER